MLRGCLFVFAMGDFGVILIFVVVVVAIVVIVHVVVFFFGVGSSTLMLWLLWRFWGLELQVKYQCRFIFEVFLWKW